MQLEVTSDQEFFQETTRKFIEAECPVSSVRNLRNSEIGYDPAYWRRGAELGWTSLLVDEADGGGSVSGKGVFEATLVAHEFGRHASPGPFLPSNLVAAALSRSGSPEQKRTVLPDLIAGAAVASWAYAEPAPHQRLGQGELSATPSGDDFVLRGVKEPVEAGMQAQHLLVSARGPAGLTQFLLPADTPGLEVSPLQSLDLTRRFARVVFDGVRVRSEAVVGSPGAGSGDVARLVQLGLVMQLAETVGAMDAAFEMTSEWAFNRYTFGRPLASYQELKHRFADMKTWLEASHAIVGAATAGVQEESQDAGEMVSVAKSYVGQYGPELAQDCVQMHGGIGVTFDHDMHLFLRRITVNRALLGTPTEHRDRLVALLESRLGLAQVAS